VQCRIRTLRRSPADRHAALDQQAAEGQRRVRAGRRGRDVERAAGEADQRALLVRRLDYQPLVRADRDRGRQVVRLVVDDAEDGLRRRPRGDLVPQFGATTGHDDRRGGTRRVHEPGRPLVLPAADVGAESLAESDPQGPVEPGRPDKPAGAPDR